MLIAGSCHANSTIYCPRCGDTVDMDAEKCSKCQVRIILIRRHRKPVGRKENSHRMENAKESPSGGYLV